MNTNTNNTAIFCFGRFSPPTAGHAIQFRAMEDRATLLDGSTYIFYSKAFDDSSNIVPPDIKEAYIKKMVSSSTVVKSADHAFNAVELLANYGYERLVYMAGGDYFDNAAAHGMLERLVKYAAGFGIRLQAEESGDRSNISGTAARRALRADDMTKFASLMYDEHCKHTLVDVLDLWNVLKQNQ